MRTYRAIIIDDESIGINALKVLIEKHSENIKIVATTTDPEQGVGLIEDYKPEIVFMDISMPKMNGFELLDKLQYKNFKLVFTTAHEEYALKAIKTKAADYLLKPIDIDELKACLAAVTKEEAGQQSTPKRQVPAIIELAVRDGIIFIKPHDIVRLEAAGSYTTFYLSNNVKHLASKSLKEYEQQLDPRRFYRCHNSHIVNLGKVVRLVSTDGLFAQMEDGSMPEISRRNKDAFLERLKNS
ncbi:MAG: LytR/AlgR family response regulator transcription factor [Bacteroidia bacterium]